MEEKCGRFGKTPLQSLKDGGFKGEGEAEGVGGKWLVKSYLEARRRDEALLESLRRQREALLARHLEVRGKVQALLCALAAGQDDQGLLSDLDALAEEIRQTF